jgi:hypothetical protein
LQWALLHTASALGRCGSSVAWSSAPSPGVAPSRSSTTMAATVAWGARGPPWTIWTGKGSIWREIGVSVLRGGQGTNQGSQEGRAYLLRIATCSPLVLSRRFQCSLQRNGKQTVPDVK